MAEKDESLRGGHPKRKRTRGKQKGGNVARIQETKPVPETNITKTFGDVEKERNYHRSSSKRGICSNLNRVASEENSMAMCIKRVPFG